MSLAQLSADTRVTAPVTHSPARPGGITSGASAPFDHQREIRKQTLASLKSIHAEVDDNLVRLTGRHGEKRPTPFEQGEIKRLKVWKVRVKTDIAELESKLGLPPST